MPKIRHLFSHAALALFPFSPVTAQTHAGLQILDRIDADVAAALGVAIGAPGGAVAPIDRRLRIAACPDAPHIDLPVSGAVAVRCPARGWRIRVPVLPVEHRDDARQRVPVVRRGQPVTLVAQTAAFSVTGEGVAVENGAVGDRIGVRVTGSRIPVAGEVLPDGRVAVPGFN